MKNKTKQSKAKTKTSSKDKYFIGVKTQLKCIINFADKQFKRGREREERFTVYCFSFLHTSLNYANLR